MFRSMFEHAVEGMFMTTPDGAYLRVNPALAEIYGYESTGQLIDSVKDIGRMLYVDPARRDQFRTILAEKGRVTDFESEIFRKDGSTIWISENARAVYGPDGGLAYYEGSVMDVTERKLAQEGLRRSESMFRSLAETAGAVIYILDQGRILYLNPAGEALLGVSREQVQGQPALDWVHPEDRELATGRTALMNDQPRASRTETIRLLAAGGAVHWVEDTVTFIDYAGRPALMGVAIDVSARKQAEARLAHQAFHDPLTDLPNRALFMERLDRSLVNCRRNPAVSFAVLFMDLDRFKLVNDSLGHQAGDQLLREIGRRLSVCLRACDTVARFGGDEFVVLLSDLSRPREANVVIERLRRSLAEPFLIQGHRVYTTTSMGVVFGSDRYQDCGEVIRDSDIAMYRAKTLGRDRFEVFDAHMHQQAKDLLQMENDLRRALERHEFRLRYQPIVSLADQRLVSMEALVCWEHPARGFLEADEFLPLAEETGLVVPIGAWVMRTACRQLAQWRQRFSGLDDLTVCVNLSARQLLQPDLVEQVRDCLNAAGLEPSCLRMEIAESALLRNPDVAGAALRRLKELGVQAAVDDFGTGYSSLGYLHGLPVDSLKVDRSFVGDLGNGSGRGAVVRSVLALARSMGLEVVADGVENTVQAAELTTLQCAYAQGQLYSDPLTPEQVASRLLRNLAFPDQPKTL